MEAMTLLKEAVDIMKFDTEMKEQLQARTQALMKELDMD